VVDLLRARLPGVAEETVAAITVEVPSYAGALRGLLGENIENAVQMALGGFLNLAARSEGADPGSPLAPALEAAYELGRGEVRSGRSMDALLAAYRVGARVAWRELSTEGVRAGLPPQVVAEFAELVFAYIDELSAASVAGHSDELATSGRARQRYLQRLAHELLLGASEQVLAAWADRADWSPPPALVAVLLPPSTLHAIDAGLDARTLRPEDELPGLDEEAGLVLVLVPHAGPQDRTRLLRLLADRGAVVGPARPWTEVRSSYLRALRARELLAGARSSVDTEAHLAELVLGADEEALTDLRARALAPLDGLRPAAAERLRETLRSWLLHRGRREQVAAELFVHPQTVRYRMGQLRDLYGDRLDDPGTVLELVLALGPSFPTPDP